MSRSGCNIEHNSKGLYDLTVFDGGQTVLVLTDLTDTEITLAQLRIIFDNDAAVDAWKQKKLDRLGGLIFEEKYPGGL